MEMVREESRRAQKEKERVQQEKVRLNTTFHKKRQACRDHNQSLQHRGRKMQLQNRCPYHTNNCSTHTSARTFTFTPTTANPCAASGTSACRALEHSHSKGVVRCGRIERQNSARCSTENVR